ncbi:MAG: cytochrome c4 [Pseudomonadales bacterium]|nr:cytochrome c4 [Pseudomonadales bacterium]
MKALIRTMVFSLGIVGFSVSAQAESTEPHAKATGNPEAGANKVMLCTGCHGTDGNSAAPMFPKLIGQNAKYIAKQLHDFKGEDGKEPARPSAQMAGMVMSLSDQDILDIAAFYASKEAPTSTTDASDEELAIGERIYRAGNMETRVPACIGCHAPNGSGNALAGFPALAGQHAAYTIAQLEAFRLASQYPDDNSKGRRNDGDGKMMRDAASRLNDRELAAVAAYIAGLR